MKIVKVGVSIVLVFALLYVAVAFVALRSLSGRIAEDETRMPALQSAMKTLKEDRSVFSGRIHEIVGKNKAKDAAVHAMLEDADLNRLAQNYLGSDFAMARSEFVGRIRTLRKTLQEQRSNRKKPNALQEKIADLEKQRRSILNETTVKKFRNGVDVSAEDRQEKIRDIDGQLSNLRYRAQIQEDKKAAQEGSARGATQGEAQILGLAESYERNNLKRLAQAMDVRMAELRNEESSCATRRDLVAFFDVWPVNALVRFVDAKTRR